MKKIFNLGRDTSKLKEENLKFKCQICEFCLLNSCLQRENIIDNLTI